MSRSLRPRPLGTQHSFVPQQDEGGSGSDNETSARAPPDTETGQDDDLSPENGLHVQFKSAYLKAHPLQLSRLILGIFYLCVTAVMLGLSISEAVKHDPFDDRMYAPIRWDIAGVNQFSRNWPIGHIVFTLLPGLCFLGNLIIWWRNSRKSDVKEVDKIATYGLHGQTIFEDVFVDMLRVALLASVTGTIEVFQLIGLCISHGFIFLSLSFAITWVATHKKIHAANLELETYTKQTSKYSNEHQNWWQLTKGTVLLLLPSLPVFAFVWGTLWSNYTNQVGVERHTETFAVLILSTVSDGVLLILHICMYLFMDWKGNRGAIMFIGTRYWQAAVRAAIVFVFYFCGVLHKSSYYS